MLGAIITHCVNCGNKLEPGDKHCTNCGVKLRIKEEVETKKPKTMKLFGATEVFLIILAIILINISVLGRRQFSIHAIEVVNYAFVFCLIYLITSLLFKYFFVIKKIPQNKKILFGILLLVFYNLIFYVAGIIKINGMILMLEGQKMIFLSIILIATLLGTYETLRKID